MQLQSWMHYCCVFNSAGSEVNSLPTLLSYILYFNWRLYFTLIWPSNIKLRTKPLPIPLIFNCLSVFTFSGINYYCSPRAHKILKQVLCYCLCRSIFSPYRYVYLIERWWTVSELVYYPSHVWRLDKLTQSFHIIQFILKLNWSVNDLIKDLILQFNYLILGSSVKQRKLSTVKT